jgi:soluble cytochrome b562
MRVQSTLPAFALLALTASVPLLTASAASVEVRSSVALVDEDSPLHEAMETLKGGQRALKKLIGDPAANQEKLMTTLRSMESAVLVAIGESPKPPEGVTGKALELHQIGYRTQMSKLLTTLLEMQTSTVNADAAALKTSYDELSATKKAGHEAYKIDD